MSTNIEELSHKIVAFTEGGFKGDALVIMRTNATNEQENTGDISDLVDVEYNKGAGETAKFGKVVNSVVVVKGQWKCNNGTLILQQGMHAQIMHVVRGSPGTLENMEPRFIPV